MKRTILAVDDDNEVASSIKDLIQTSNPKWSVLTSNSGHDCLRILDKTKVDLILLDIMIPDIDGWELTYKLKKMQNLKDIPIIYVTAKADEMSREVGRLVGTDYITKPFDPKDFMSKISKVLK